MRCDFVRGKRKLRDFDTWFRRFGKECVYITEGCVFLEFKDEKSVKDPYIGNSFVIKYKKDNFKILHIGFLL